MLKTIFHAVDWEERYELECATKGASDNFSALDTFLRGSLRYPEDAEVKRDVSTPSAFLRAGVGTV